MSEKKQNDNKYDKLKSIYNKLSSEHEELLNDHEALERDLEAVESNYEYVENRNKELEKMLEEKQITINVLNNDLKYYKHIANEAGLTIPFLKDIIRHLIKQ